MPVFIDPRLNTLVTFWRNARTAGIARTFLRNLCKGGCAHADRAQ